MCWTRGTKKRRRGARTRGRGDKAEGRRQKAAGSRALCLSCLLPTAYCLLFFVGCRQQMGQQPKYKPLEESSFFADGRSARKPVGGTIARSLRGDEAQPVAFKSGAAYTNDFPYPVTQQLLKRGRERYEINCAACHGLSGYGDGMIVRRGFSPPPSYHSDQVRNQPVGFYFDVITNGYGAMASYSTQVSAEDRWAIIAYIRALQLSQHASPDDAPPEERGRLGNGGEGK